MFVKTAVIFFLSKLFHSQSYDHTSFRARKHSPWLADFNRGMMINSENGVSGSLIRRRRPIRIPRERFYQRTDYAENLKPFYLLQLAMSFAFLGLGLLGSGFAMIFEIVN